MKKYHYSLIVAFSCFLIAFQASADVILRETFSSATLPAGWTNTVISGSQGWTFRNNPLIQGGTATGFYAVFNDEELGATTRPNSAALVTPAFSCVGRSQVILSYRHYWLALENTSGKVEISVNNGAWQTLVTYSTTTFGSQPAPPLGPVTTDSVGIDITSYVSGSSNVRVRFVYSDGNIVGGKYWYLDNITIFAPSDLGISELMAPNYLSCGSSYSNAETVTVRIYNYSDEPYTGTVPVTCKVTGGITTTLNANVAVNIQPRSYQDYTFPTTLDMSADAPYNFEIYTYAVPTDNYRKNDTLLIGRHNLTSIYPYTENFENGDGGWKITNQNPNRTWKRGVVPYLGGADGKGKSIYLENNIQDYGWFWIESPLFNFSSLTNPLMSFDIKYDWRCCNVNLFEI